MNRYCYKMFSLFLKKRMEMNTALLQKDTSQANSRSNSSPEAHIPGLSSVWMRRVDQGSLEREGKKDTNMSQKEKVLSKKQGRN